MLTRPQSAFADFYTWLSAVNRDLFRGKAESVFDYPEIPWETWFTEKLTREEIKRRFDEEEE